VKSFNPATGDLVWEGAQSTPDQITNIVQTMAQTKSVMQQSKRLHCLNRFKDILTKHSQKLATAISNETGKIMGEAVAEVNACIAKIDLSIQAHSERCPNSKKVDGDNCSEVFYKPIGLLAVYGPYNFPAHLPNGHIVPALIAGNRIVFKPSEYTPQSGELLVRFLYDAGFNQDHIQIVQGDKTVGKLLSEQQQLNGILFTGSYPTGAILHKNYGGHIDKMLALELGGNNPLVVESYSDMEAAVFHIVMSGYLTSGQRCTCARRLIVIDNPSNRQLLQQLVTTVKKLTVGASNSEPTPFMGPLISNPMANAVLQSYNELAKDSQILVPMQRLQQQLPFVSPGLLDVTDNPNRIDREIFGPLLQLIWVADIAEAIAVANQTSYGLSASIFTQDDNVWNQFKNEVKAGIINRNQATNGAKGDAPFGGVGNSGNFRPSAWFATDYCSYPVASNQSKQLTLPPQLPRGYSK